MMRRKNLERAVILGMLLSTSVYGSAWAETIGGQQGELDIRRTGENLIVKSDGNIGLEFDGIVDIKKDENGNGGKLIIEVTGDGANAIAAYAKDNALFTVLADEIDITSGDNGLVTLPEGSSHASVVLGSEERKIQNLSIYAGGQGIDNKNGDVYIYGADDSIIRITSNTKGGINFNQAAVNNESDGNIVISGGSVYLKTESSVLKFGDGITNSKSGTVTVTANDKVIMDVTRHGINNTNGIVTLNTNGSNSITADENAVYNHGSGTITISATAGTGDEGISTLANYEDYNNKLVGGKNGVQSDSTGTTNVIAANNNVIAGTKNGILSDGAGTITVTAGNNNTIGQYTDGSGNIVTSDTGINVTKGTVSVTASGDNVINTSNIGIRVLNGGKVNLAATNGNNTIKTTKYGVYAYNSGEVYLKATSGNNTVSSDNTGIFVNSASITLDAGNTNKVTGNAWGIYADSSAVVALSAGENNIVHANTSGQTNGVKAINSSITLEAGNSNEVNGFIGIDERDSSKVHLKATSGNNTVNGHNMAISATGSSTTKLEAGNNNKLTSNGYGVYSYDSADVDLLADVDNTVSGKIFGVFANNAFTTLDAGNNNEVTGDNTGVCAYNLADVDLIADENNALYAGKILTDEETQLQYGKAYAVNALSGSNVTLDAGNANDVYGAVYANGTGTDAKGNKVSTNVILNSANNIVKSAASIANAGGLTNTTVISALYAEAGAQINVSGENNTIMTYYSKPEDDTTSERVIWAYDSADITINGNTIISTAMYDESPNNMDIAVVAGTATGLDKLSADEILGYDGDRANVDINYESDSSITGDILSAYAGTVNIAANSETTRAASDSKIDIRGNLLAGNNGILNVDLGNGGTLTGRADDYGDAGLNTGHGAVEGEDSFFNPAFSSEIKANGTVNLTMGEGSVWNVTGQSWITKLNTTENVADTLINLENAKDEELNINASALTIGTLNGSTQFYMNLDGDRSASDMLYIKNADGQYNIYLQEEVTSSEINADGFNGLRFATVGEGSNADFTVRSQGTGSAFDVVYTVGTDSYEGNSENTAYNSTTGEGGANTQKPGNASVDDFFGLTNNAVEDDSEIATNSIMLMAENEEAADNAANANSGLNEVTNFKIIARADEELNDTGETILNMSRANYSNAIYMDRLNKRLGEARYINDDPEEDEGMWVRIRHDRIGKDDAYRSQNTMYELGYDKKQDCDNGERRVGFAVDYMHGDTGYTDIAGKGEIDRYGLWLYDTWMGDKGHYVDYVAKWGHLDNDFEVYTMRDSSQKVTGDYSNNVFSVSAEYGRKKDIGNDWYFEPQAQLQLARVTGADYTTNQGTKVSVDGINSLIGRAGFRIGKDFGEEKQSTLYFKADVLHEFLGDQDVYVMDKSTDNKWAGISYDNEGTWYDIGIGYAAMMSKSSYAFIDLEQSFGNDNDETYQINAGVQWTF